MHVVIIGAGEVGTYVARVLVDQGHEVVVVELDEETAQRLDASMDAMVIRGNGVQPNVLRRAGIDRAELMLAVTPVDEVNLIACMTARKHGGATLRVLARVGRAQHLGADEALSAQDLGLDALISPEGVIATSAVQILRYVGNGEVREMAGGRLVLVGMELGADSPLVHETLAELRPLLPKECVVVAAQGREGIRIPGGSDRLEPDERVFILTLPEHLTELTILSAQPWHRVRRVLMVGCGNTGLALARELERENFGSTIIEMDLARAERVAGLLSESTVLHGDGSDPDMLKSRIEEGEHDAVVVLLKDPEKSLLIGIFAKSLGAHKVVVRCDRAAYAHLAYQVGIDAIISPKRAIGDAILRHLSRNPVATAMMLGENEAEILGFHVPTAPENAHVVRQPLKELRFPAGALVGAILRDGGVIIPTGETVLRPNDELFVVTRIEAIERVGALLA